MAKLRDMIDGRLLAAVPAKPQNTNPDEDDPSEQMKTAPSSKGYPSPAGQHVANNLQDPYGATKDELDELNQAKLAYEMKKAQMQMKLQPVKSVVDGISQMHEMNDPNQSPDAQMGYTDPNDPTGGNMAMSPQGGAAPGAMPPQNGAMPGMPGVPPGQPKEAIRPLKLGMPKPGMGSPAQVAGAPGQQFNPAAPKPAGAGSLPGANGPGAAKPQNAIKKAQSGKSGGKSGGSSSSGKVAIHVHADSTSRSPAKRTLDSYAGADFLRSASCHKEDDECACGDHMKAYGTSEGVKKEWQSRGHGKKEPIVDINDKRGFNAPIDKQKVSPAKSEDKKWGKDWDEGFSV